MFIVRCADTWLIRHLQLQLQYRDHPHHAKAPPNVVYAHLKYMWATGAQEESLEFLRKFTASLARDLQPEGGDHIPNAATKKKLDELSRLLARCFFKQGQWQVAMHDEWGNVSV